MSKRKEQVCKKCRGALTTKELFQNDGYCFLCVNDPRSANTAADERDIAKALRRERIN